MLGTKLLDTETCILKTLTQISRNLQVQ